MQAEWEDRLTAEALSSLQGTSHAPAVSASPAELELAFSVCRRITFEHSRTFFFASALLPAQKRRAVRALYAFCRSTDDIVDEKGVDAAERMRSWRDAVAAPVPPPDHPVLLAWSHVRTQYRIPDTLPAKLIESVSRDLHQTRYSSFDDLVDYCYGVASTVGLMSMKIIGFSGEEAAPYALKLGIAMQLTNILRDVAQDYGMGRIYLPQDELNAYGIDETHLAQGVVNENWRRFMRFQIDRARRLYSEARPGIPMLSADGQFAIAAASELYAGILGQIERQGYDVFSRRAQVPQLAKACRLPGIYLRLLSARRSTRHQA
ncbi:MAG: phytoene/squalene synthase family protein [Armatimonadetes bacterium]|nr:phytoene/squalene synthase family protein [Armatimonadota bacterium]